MERSVAIAKLLVENGCDPGLKNNMGISPIMAAVEQVGNVQ